MVFKHHHHLLTWSSSVGVVVIWTRLVTYNKHMHKGEEVVPKVTQTMVAHNLYLL